MELIHIIVLAVIQGLTEFLPISSSAHLILPAEVLGWEDQGLAFDVAVHVGSLVAVVWYFRADIIHIVRDWLLSLFGNVHTTESRLGWYLILGTIPVGLMGYIFDHMIETYLRSIAVIIITTIFFGIMLGLADRYCRGAKTLHELGWRSALLVGLAQAVALIPGTSRSGITITAALALGFDRQTAARFSFLLSIPVIVLSGGYKTLQLANMEEVIWGDMILGAVCSGVTAYLCIRLFLTWINRIGMMPFVWYRLALGVVLLTVLMA